MRITLLLVSLFVGASSYGYFRGGSYVVEIDGDGKAVQKSRYLDVNRNGIYHQLGNGQLVPQSVYDEPIWYTVVPANQGAVDVFYVQSGQRRHMRAKADLWQKYGWDCRFNIGEQGPVQFGGKTWY